MACRVLAAGKPANVVLESLKVKTERDRMGMSGPIFVLTALEDSYLVSESALDGGHCAGCPARCLATSVCSVKFYALLLAF